MEEELKQRIETLFEDATIKDILYVYLIDNCYGEVVDYLVDHINDKLAKLHKIEQIMKNT